MSKLTILPIAALLIVMGLSSCSMTGARSQHVERLRLRQAKSTGTPSESNKARERAEVATNTVEVRRRNTVHQPSQPADPQPARNNAATSSAAGSGTEFSLSLDEMSALIDSALPESRPAPTERTAPPETQPPSAPQFSSLKYATPVPGKPGFVSLSTDGGVVPEIDVRGIAPGTPVEIPHPSKGGQTIKFKVP